MKLIIGGCFQGKEAYTKEIFGFSDVEIIDGETCGEEEIFTATCMNHFHLYIRKRLEEKKDITTLAEELIEKNPNLCIICDEVGYGIVPMEAFERFYRESVGRTCGKLSKYASEVHRVVCGIGSVIKGC